MIIPENPLQTKPNSRLCTQKNDFESSQKKVFASKKAESEKIFEQVSRAKSLHHLLPLVCSLSVFVLVVVDVTSNYKESLQLLRNAMEASTRNQLWFMLNWLWSLWSLLLWSLMISLMWLLYWQVCCCDLCCQACYYCGRRGQALIIIPIYVVKLIVVCLDEAILAQGEQTITWWWLISFWKPNQKWRRNSQGRCCPLERRTSRTRRTS